MTASEKVTVSVRLTSLVGPIDARGDARDGWRHRVKGEGRVEAAATEVTCGVQVGAGGYGDRGVPAFTPAVGVKVAVRVNPEPVSSERLPP